MKNQPTIVRLIKAFSLPAMFFLMCFLGIGVSAVAETKDKATLGEVEDVVLFPWKVKLPARIDTGATRSCLDARDIRIDGSMVEFRLPEKYGEMLLRLPVKGRRNIRSAHGRMKRPVVDIELCIGTKRILTSVSLADRSKMEYPLLIGRSVLVNNFLVDVSKSRVLAPTCPPGATQ